MSNLQDHDQRFSSAATDEMSCQSPISKKIRKHDKNQGHWTKEEHEIYLEFLEQNAHNRKNTKMFKPMSELIGTRTPSQCRSHHQKFNPQSPQVQRKIQSKEKKVNYSQSTFEKSDDQQIQLIKYDDDYFVYVDPIELLFQLDDAF